MKRMLINLEPSYLGADAGMEDAYGWMNFAVDWAYENGYNPYIADNVDYEIWLHEDPGHREIIERCWEDYLKYLHQDNQ